MGDCAADTRTVAVQSTLADQKAILFYLGFLPAFVDFAVATAVDVGLVAAITIITVGGVKAGYAYLAARTGVRIANSGHATFLHYIAAVLLVVIGCYLILNA